MKDQSKREVVLPFPGFYNSIYSSAIDFAEENEAEFAAEREADARHYPETFQADERLRLTAADFAELCFEHCDYGKVYHKVAQFYVEAFDGWAHDELELPANSFAFVILDSPREYNFTTDRVFATVSEEAIAALFACSAAEGHAALAEVIRERFTSRDGFIPFYDDELESWLEKPLAEWDHNELGTLLRACIQLVDAGDDFEMELYERTFSGNGEEDEARDAGMDWPAYEAALAGLRETKSDLQSQ